MNSVLCGPLAYDGAFPGLKPAMDPKEHFYRHFEAQATSLQDDIANLGDIAVTGGERKDATDHILAGISRLTDEVSDASEYAPPRDQMIYNEALKALREQLNIQTSRLGPENRFAFSPQSKEKFLSSSSCSPPPSPPRPDEDDDAVISQPEKQAEADSLGDLPHFDGAGGAAAKNYNAEIAAHAGGGIRKPSFSAARDIDISSHRGMHILLPATASRATASGRVADLRGCVLDMSVPTLRGAGARRSSPFASLVVRDVARSLIVAGHVAGPAHITGVRDSVLVVNARQVRIHECENLSVYLWSASRPIIEDCKGVRFAEIPTQYLTSGQKSANNQWDQVDDFNWLKAEASPNWKTITDEDERFIPREFWETTVHGGPLLGTDDILREAGIV